MNNKKKVWLVILLIVVALIVAVKLWFDFAMDGTRTVLSLEKSNSNQAEMSYQLFYGEKEYHLKADDGDYFEVTIVSEDGKLDMEISLSDSGESIYSGKDIPSSDFTVGIKKSGNYMIRIIGDHHRGSYSVVRKSVENKELQEESKQQETQFEQTMENNGASNIDMPILDEINQNVQIGTTGAYMTAVQEAVRLLDWGVGTGLDPEEIRAATVDWLMDKGNDEQVQFAEKLRQVDDVYHKLLGNDAEDLLESAGCKDAAYPWSTAPVESIEAIMDAVGLRSYEETGDIGTESDDWKAAFEESLYSNYQVTVDHYEDLGDGVYQVYVVIDGKTVPYVTVDSKTGDYHG